MDQNPLVTEQIDDGRAIIDQCVADGVDITAAFWLKPSEDGQWYLYIATETVEDKGIAAAFKAVLGAIRRLSHPPRLNLLGDLKVVGASNPVTVDVLGIQSRYAAPLATRYRGNRLGPISIDEAYLYPVSRTARTPA